MNAAVDAIAAANRTETPFPGDVTLQALIEAQVEVRTADTALLCDHESAATLTYAALNAKANQVAHTLWAHGVGRGDIVAIMVERSAAMLAGIFGIVKSGAAYLPVSPDNPPDRIEYMLRNADARGLLVHHQTQHRVAFDCLAIDIDGPDVGAAPDTNPPIAATSRDLAYVIYTSGSTGRPKGVMIEHRSVVNRLRWMQQAYPIGPGDVLLQKTPFSFDVSVWELFWWALDGASLAVLPPGGERNPLTIVDTIHRHRVNVVHFVPSMLNVFLEYLEGRGRAAVERLRSVRTVFASGEALTPSHVRKFNGLVRDVTGARLVNLYGPTEATVDVSYFDCTDHDGVAPVPIGRPIHNTKLYVIKDGRYARMDETGELCIAGVGLARGYLNNPALTAERFVDNPVNPGERVYRTGDVARWLADGNLEYLGREDHQVKIRGLRIELGEIESTAREYPGINDCVAIVRSYSDSIVVIAAYVACGAAVDLAGLKAHLKSRLPEYMVPSQFVRLVAIPLTPSGKADRKALLEPDSRPAAASPA